MMNADDATRLLERAAQLAAAYQQHVIDRPVAPTAEALAALAAFDEPFPETPTSAAETLELLDRVGSPATMATTGGRYFGFVNGAVLPGA